MNWGALTGGLFGSSAATRTDHDAVDFYAARFDTTDVYAPAGRVLLGSLPVTVLTGTPLVTIAATTPLSAHYLTSFGSQCRGADGEFTMILGRDWFDAGGTFGTLLSNVSGSVFRDASPSATGSCPTGSGDVGMAGWVVTLNPGGRQALTSSSGAYHFDNVLPGVYTLQASVPTTWVQTCPPGNGAQSVTVLLNQTFSGLNFGVKPANLPPLMNPLSNQTIPIGTTTDVALSASDPDGSSITFSLVNGPSFASVQTTGPGSGVLHLSPVGSDAGAHGVTVSASDGVFNSRRSATYKASNTAAVATRPSTAPPALISPNPFNPSGSLKFRTSKPGFVRAGLYDVNGRRVRALWDKPHVAAGLHEIPIDGRDDLGSPLPSGIYFFRLETIDGTQSGRATVVK